jgi:threonine/homoserine/homoserine lactone efflux protein
MRSPCASPAQARKLISPQTHRKVVAMDLLPSPAALVAFVLASCVFVITPGPDLTYYLGQTVSRGRAAGVAAVLGNSLGLLCHSTLAALGLSALLAASASAFTVLKIVGAVYLAWLGIQALRHGSALNLKGGSGDGRLGPVFAKGVLINILNPKVIVFFITFLPQFVAAGEPNIGVKLFLLGVLYIVLSIPISFLIVAGAGGFAGMLQRSARARRTVDYLFAGVMGAFAVKLLATRAG